MIITFTFDWAHCVGPNCLSTNFPKKFSWNKNAVYMLRPGLKTLNDSNKRAACQRLQSWKIIFRLIKATVQIFCRNSALKSCWPQRISDYLSVFVLLCLCISLFISYVCIVGEVTWGNQGNNEPPPRQTAPPNSTSPPPFPLLPHCPPRFTTAGWERMPHPGSIRNSHSMFTCTKELGDPRTLHQ